MSSTNQIAAYLTPHKLHWNKILNRLVVAFLFIRTFVAKSPSDHKQILATHSPEIILKTNLFLVITREAKANQLAERCSAVEPRFGKNLLLIIAIGMLTGFDIKLSDWNI